MSAPRRLQLTDPAKQCPYCFETSLDAKRYKRCDLVWYCNHLCQAHHGHKHKLVCIPKEEQAKRKVANEALVSSSLQGHLIAVRDLLEKHMANVNYVNDKGLTALYLASSEDHPEVIDVLVAAGARVGWVQAECGFTALGIASQEGQLQAVSSLIRANADPNQVTTTEWASSPLMMAAQEGHALVIDALAAAGAHMDYARPKDGATALFLASQEGHLQAVSSLIRADANPNQVRTDEWATLPMMIAA
jgi:ankyrin repeat protein